MNLLEFDGRFRMRAPRAGRRFCGRRYGDGIVARGKERLLFLDRNGLASTGIEQLLKSFRSKTSGPSSPPWASVSSVSTLGTTSWPAHVGHRTTVPALRRAIPRSWL